MQNERLAQAAARADSRAAKLAIGLITSRIEGEATGILMAKHQVTQTQAASLLRQASQERQRELHEVAAGIVRSGDLDSLLQRGVAASNHHRSGRIRLGGALSQTAASRPPTDRQAASARRLAAGRGQPRDARAPVRAGAAAVVPVSVQAGGACYDPE